MAKKVVVQVRLPAGLVEKLDVLTEQGLYRDRTEAITDGIISYLQMDRIQLSRT